MKRYLFIFTAIILMNTGYSQCQGDANLDNIVNILDVILMVNHILDTDPLIDEGFDNSDLNADDGIDIIDIVIIVDILLTGDTECEQFYPIDLSLEWELQQDLSYFDSEELTNIIDNQISQMDYINGMIVIHNGKIVSESYYSGSSVNQTFNIWSVTKSFISTLIGQAIDQGLIESENLAIDELLPDFGQIYLQGITLSNLLSMSSGYYDGFGYPNWVYATTQQLEWMAYTYPGYFFYNNSACHLNSHILYYTTDMTPEEFAGINLFPYLGIVDPQWLSGFNGINDGSASLELTLRDMVKLGQLYIQDGYSGENQILSDEWIQEATSFQISTGGWAGELLSGYGYLWWLPPEGYLAYGYGGQYIAVLPERNLVVGTHSNVSSTVTYQTQLREYIYNSIAPLFNDN